MDYETYLWSREWKQRANEAKQRAGWQCALCEETKSLEVHHRTYQRVGRERPSDLVVLCWRCHRRHHGTLEATMEKQRRYDEMLPFEYRFPRGEELN